jgi:hypothetical protein
MDLRTRLGCASGKYRFKKQVRAATDFPVALDGFGLARECIVVKARRKPIQKREKLIRPGRSRILRLPSEFSCFEPDQGLFSRPWAHPVPSPRL